MKPTARPPAWHVALQCSPTVGRGGTKYAVPGQRIASVECTPAISSSDSAEAIPTDPLRPGHSTRPSMCCSKGTQRTVVHPAAVTIISEEDGKERLMAATLSRSYPDVR